MDYIELGNQSVEEFHKLQEKIVILRLRSLI